MELTLASAFSQEGLLGHAAYVLLVLSMLMRTLLWLRLLVIASAILGDILRCLHPRRPGSRPSGKAALSS